MNIKDFGYDNMFVLIFLVIALIISLFMDYNNYTGRKHGNDKINKSN